MKPFLICLFYAALLVCLIAYWQEEDKPLFYPGLDDRTATINCTTDLDCLHLNPTIEPF